MLLIFIGAVANFPKPMGAANRGLGGAVVERSRTRYPWRISAARRHGVLGLSSYATKIGRSLVPATELHARLGLIDTAHGDSVSRRV
jgi:hypothetical protein